MHPSAKGAGSFIEGIVGALTTLAVLCTHRNVCPNNLRKSALKKWLPHSVSIMRICATKSKVAEYLAPDDARIPHYPPTGCEVIYEEEEQKDATIAL